MIATTTASFIVPNAPLYTVPLYPISPDVYLWVVIASPFIGLWSVAFVRAIAWAYRVRPSDWRRFIAPPLVLAVIGLISIVFPESLGNGQDVAQLLFLHPLEPIALAVLVFIRPIATIGSVASGAPGGLFTPSLAAGALAGAVLGQLWLWVHPGGDIGLFALLGAGAMLAASTQEPVSSLVLMMELTGQARAFALPMITAIVVAAATTRLIDWRSVDEARLTDEEVAERLLAREPRGGWQRLDQPIAITVRTGVLERWVRRKVKRTREAPALLVRECDRETKFAGICFRSPRSAGAEIREAPVCACPHAHRTNNSASSWATKSMATSHNAPRRARLHSQPGDLRLALDPGIVAGS